MTQQITSLITRLEKRIEKAKHMRLLAREIRSVGRMITSDEMLAEIAEAIAVLLEELP